MRKLLFLLAGTAVLCLPAVSAAAKPSSPGAKLAVKMCKSIRAQEGRQTFRLTYHSVAGCIKQTRPMAREALHNASQTCRAERSDANFAATHDGKTFNQFYGTNAGSTHGAGKNAFGKCVSTNAKLNAKNDVAASVAAAKACKALKASDLATFQSTYGKARNAFGKCVAAQSSATQG
jgi:hypothetical protein